METPRIIPSRAGFTLIELMIVASILGALAALAIPNYQRVAERARITKAIGDITAIGQAAQEFYLENSQFPPSLSAIGYDSWLDPWGRAYVYVRVQGASTGDLRKDRFLVPVNSDFDLYSVGADGQSAPPFTAANSRDDVVRANDGGFVGLAEQY